MSYSHAWGIHTHHSNNVAISVIGRAMTAMAQAWWLAVGTRALGDKNTSSRDAEKVILIGQTTLDDV
jgi:hypothetical protein